jgi:hypothetical protein
MSNPKGVQLEIRYVYDFHYSMKGFRCRFQVVVVVKKNYLFLFI